jgi:hypothetical protein
VCVTNGVNNGVNCAVTIRTQHSSVLWVGVLPGLPYQTLAHASRCSPVEE